MAVAVDWVEYTSHDFLYAKVLKVLRVLRVLTFLE